MQSAIAKNDVASVRTAVQAWEKSLGESAGEEAEESVFFTPPEETKMLEKAAIPTAFAGHFAKITANRWWETLKSPVESPATPRAVAGVLEGLMAAKTAGCEPQAELAKEAGLAADFLKKALADSGGQKFPLPAWVDKKGGFPQKIAKAIAAAPDGSLVKNGWFIGDLPGGDSLEENAACGLALLRWFRQSKDEPSLKAAKTAAEWAASQPPTANWANNSLTVELLVEMHRETKQPQFLEAASKFISLGILPGQITAGPREGRWLDPQNAKLVQHYRMVRALAVASTELPKGTELADQVETALIAGLIVRNVEIISQGASQPAATADVFMYLLENTDAFEELCSATQVAEAANRTLLGLMAEFEENHPTVTPAIWGKFLRYLATTPKN